MSKATTRSSFYAAASTLPFTTRNSADKKEENHMFSTLNENAKAKVRYGAHHITIPHSFCFSLTPEYRSPGQRDLARKFSFFERGVYKSTPSEENGNRTKTLIRNGENLRFSTLISEKIRKKQRGCCATKHNVLCFCSFTPKCRSPVISFFLFVAYTVIGAVAPEQAAFAQTYAQFNE